MLPAGDPVSPGPAYPFDHGPAPTPAPTPAAAVAEAPAFGAPTTSVGRADASVPPPGYVGAAVEAPAAAAVPAPAAPLAAGPVSAADAALRWRVKAARLDNLIIYLVYLAFCGAAHWRVVSLTHLLWLSVGAVAYHFFFESRTGQTPGKRRYGIQVRHVDGGAADAKAIALRSVLRGVDQLPAFYISGLVSMVRTGAARRQRIGDVAARTTVIAVDNHAVSRGTPSWYLPTATIVAVVLTAAVAVADLYVRSAPLNDTQATAFVAACQASAPGENCQCVLRALQADGYETVDSLNTLFGQEQAAVAAGQPQAGPRALLDAARLCRV